MNAPTPKEIRPYIEKKLVNEQTHPEFPELSIFNYTHGCQINRKWDEVTLQCRGLIYNTKTNQLVARPFRKFFNLSEHDNGAQDKLDILENDTPEIYEKYDGSLGILYRRPDGKPAIATRGSFDSEQARWATQWLINEVNIPWTDWDLDRHTHLFEIVYDQNRIVVDYDFEGLVYLSTIDQLTGEGSVHAHFNVPPMKIAEQIHNTDWRALHKLAEDNKEGFVLWFPKSNVRVKVKFDEYLRLHKILTGLSVKGIWEYLMHHGIGSDISEIAADAPDEFYEWITMESEKIKSEYKQIADTYISVFADLYCDYNNRKEFAIEASKHTYPHLLFALYDFDKKRFERALWKLCKPESTGKKVFHKDIDL